MQPFRVFLRLKAISSKHRFKAMKTQWLSIFFLSLSNYALAQQTGTSVLEKFLQEKDFLKLEASYRQQKDTLSELNSLYYGAFIDNASNRCTQSAKKIESLLKYHKSELTPQTAPPLLNVQMDNFVKLNAYRKAAKVGEQILASYSTFLDSAKVADLKNTIKLWRALENAPPQQITKVESRVKWTRDKIGLMNIPIRIGNQVSDFVFDTGANLSTISLSYAQKLKLKIIATSIDLGSSTSIQNQAMLAIAPSIFIDKTELKNVVFLVLPDKNLQFPQLDFAIHGIIGFPVMNLLREVQIARDGQFYIPPSVSNNVGQNLFLDELTPVIQLQVGDDTLLCHFDTGAMKTELFKKYYDANKSKVESEGKIDSIGRGGAGGVHKIEVYKIPLSTFTIQGKKAALANLPVLTESVGDFDAHFYGNIGQDIINQFNKMTINFQSMYIDFN